MNALVDILHGAGLHELAKAIKDISPERGDKDYEALRGLPCKTRITPHQGKTGNIAMDRFFFEKRLATADKKGDTFESFVNRKGHLHSPSAKRLYQYNIDHGKSPTTAKYDVFRLYHGSINAFKPLWAKELYCKFKPKTVLDFSAGWGGRMLGAMATNTNYIGFDTNTDLRKAYAEMIKAYPHDCKVAIHFQDSSKVDYSRFTYDMVFTSPPYFQKTKPTEAYRNMPHYEDREDFNKRFFFPVVEKTWKHLQTGGHYCLNIPIDMYEDVKEVLGACDSKIPLAIQARFSAKEHAQHKQYKEFIYVWNKGARGGLSTTNTPFGTPGSTLPPPTGKNPMLVVKRSPTHGRGLFAKVAIPKGTRIADYEGKEMSDKEYKEKYGDDTRYSYGMKWIHKIIDGKQPPFLTGNLTHYANESKSPNIRYEKRGVYAVRDLHAGEELFLSYPKKYPRTYKL
jgi:hypothetical protein